MNKHIPHRMCIACRQMKPKEELIRVVVVNDRAIVDKDYKHQSRGAYVCKNKNCAAKLNKMRGVERHLGVNATDVYDEINMFIPEN